MDDNLKELEALREENERLKEKNDKLYRDCVSFAKKIKAHEDEYSRISELETENENLKSEIARLASSERINEYNDSSIDLDDFPIEKSRNFSIKAVSVSKAKDDEEVSQEEVFIPIIEEPIETEETFLPASIDDAEEQVFPNIIAPEPLQNETSIPKNHSTHKKSPFLTFIRTIIWIFFIISLIIGVISSITYLFSTAYEDYAIMGYRFASVFNNSLSPAITKDDIVLIEYKSFDGIELGSPVVTTKDGRSIGTLKGLDFKDGIAIATIKDKNGTYTANTNQFIGAVKFKIPYVGKVIQYACQYQYNYLAIVVAANLVFLALLLIIPSNKSRGPKFGKDYTVEDFTI